MTVTDVSVSIVLAAGLHHWSTKCVVLWKDLQHVTLPCIHCCCAIKSCYSQLQPTCSMSDNPACCTSMDQKMIMQQASGMLHIQPSLVINKE